jgi:hypothetical protein
MYHLFVSGSDEAWRGDPYEIELPRVLREFTAEPLTQRFGALADESVEALKLYPALFAHENHHNLPAKIGWITRVRHRNREVRVEYELESALPQIPAERLLQLQWELDFTDWEMNRTHWALKDVDLFPVLMEAGLINPDLIDAQPPNSRIRTIGMQQQPAPDIEARPSVFRVPAEPRDNSLVSVMMPFTHAFDAVYAAIARAAQAAGMTCQRADNIWEAEEVIQDIFSLIYRSSIVVCDFTNQNPNVFYEAGIAHTLGRAVVPISQNEQHVPFDLRHHRYLQYLNNGEGLEGLVARLTPRLSTLRRRL